VEDFLIGVAPQSFALSELGVGLCLGVLPTFDRYSLAHCSIHFSPWTRRKESTLKSEDVVTIAATDASRYGHWTALCQGHQAGTLASPGEQSHCALAFARCRVSAPLGTCWIGRLWIDSSWLRLMSSAERAFSCAVAVAMHCGMVYSKYQRSRRDAQRFSLSRSFMT